MPQTFTVGARSRFVTALAWIVILIATVSALSTVLGRVAQPLWLAATAVLLSAGAAVAATGLLRRLDWARRLLPGLLLLAIVAHLPTLWVQYERLHGLLHEVLRQGGALPPLAMQAVQGVLLSGHGLAVMLALLTVSLLAWIVRQLGSTMICQEFA